MGPPGPRAWSRLHQRLASRAGWEHHDAELPVIDGTLIRLQVDHLPGNRDPEPLWPWTTAAGTAADTVNRTWQAFLRRFDREHTFRFLKTGPRLAPPQAPLPRRCRPVDLPEHRLLNPCRPRP